MGRGSRRYATPRRAEALEQPGKPVRAKTGGRHGGPRRGGQRRIPGTDWLPRAAILDSATRWRARVVEASVQRDLVERAQQGDHDAFALLAGAALGRLDTAARLVLRDPERAKDAVQEALVRAWRDLPGLRDPDRFDAWLHRLLVRACHDELRKHRRRRLEVELVEIDMHDPTESARLLDDRDEIERGFRRLDPDQRLVVVLHYYLDLPLPEVAATLGVPLGTAKSRLHRGLAVLRRALGAYAGESRAGQDRLPAEEVAR